MNYKKQTTLVILILSYFLLKYAIPGGIYVIYPINLIVTFLHEFGHGFSAFLTGGEILSIEISSNGSGYAVTSGGILPVILMGGYIGSAIFGNLLLYIGAKKPNHSEKIIYLLAGLMIFTSVVWFSSEASSVVLVTMAILLILLTKKTKYDSTALQFLGVATILFIIEDFNVGPSSDIQKFSEIFPVINSYYWMMIWLIIVLSITFLNFKKILKK